MNFRRCLVAVCLVLSSLIVLADDDHHHDASEGLGAVSFPTSCAPTVQKSFDRGVALLHSFEYEQAEKQFREVSAGPPQRSLALCGEAMRPYHQPAPRPPHDDEVHRPAP